MIRQIGLYNNLLNGSIPESIGNLTALTYVGSRFVRMAVVANVFWCRQGQCAVVCEVNAR